jgi:hypothetical protein
MASYAERQQRVANGSRRKRDLAAVQFDYDAFAAQHFPEQRVFAVKAAMFQIHARSHKRIPPTPAQVKARMEEMGWWR